MPLELHNTPLTSGVLAAQWQAAHMLAGGRRAGRQRCRELIQASLQAAVEVARREVLSATSAPPATTFTTSVDKAHGTRGLGLECDDYRIILVTGSLHAVAAAQRLEEVAALLARAQHHNSM
jgi:hypothetical protein